MESTVSEISNMETWYICTLAAVIVVIIWRHGKHRAVIAVIIWRHGKHRAAIAVIIWRHGKHRAAIAVVIIIYD